MSFFLYGTFDKCRVLARFKTRTEIDPRQSLKAQVTKAKSQTSTNENETESRLRL